PARAYEFQMLYGMADAVKAVLANMGHRVRVYTPFGQLLPGMAYLVRRLLENTSNESFLRAGFVERVPEDQLLADPNSRRATPLRGRDDANGNGHPHDSFVDQRFAAQEDAQGRCPAAIELSRPRFRNEPPSDFSRAGPREAMRMSLEQLKPFIGATYP